MPHAVPAFLNSLQLAAIATVVSLVIAFLGAWLLERDRAWFRPIIQPTMLSSLAFPGAVVGIALIVAYAREPFSLAGGLTIIAFAYVVRTLPFSFSYVRAGLQQLGGESEEAARSLGASWFRTFRSITFPLLRTTLLSAGILNFVLLFRELEASIFLYTGRSPVISVVLYTLSTESRFQMMGAFSIVVLVINIGMVLVATRLFGSAASARNER
jgi:iron(III) transport system permease protein